VESRVVAHITLQLSHCIGTAYLTYSLFGSIALWPPWPT